MTVVPTIEVRPRGLVGLRGRPLRRLLAVAVLAWLALTLVSPRAAGLLCLALSLAAGWWLRRRLAVDPLARDYLVPVSDAIASPIGARFRLSVAAEHVRPPRPARELSPAEQTVRAWWGTHVEPLVRWMPDQLARARAAVIHLLAPAARLLDQVRRPRPERAAVRLTVWRPYLTPEQRGYVEAVIRAKIPLPDCTVQWRQIGPRVVATWTVRRPAPRRAGYEQLLAAWPALQETDLYCGESAGGPVVVSLHDDSPHIALSAGSGAGKSVLAQLLAVQVLARGGSVLILDRKGSHRWAVGLPRVAYARRPAQMHDLLIRAAELADQRNQMALDEPEGWDPGPRVLVIMEELNATIGQLQDHWADVRQTGEPRTSPAIRALRELLYMGRSAKINVIAIAQMLTARAIGGPEARENFAIRCLARYTSNAWRMLVPHVPMPRPTRHVGRWQIVAGGVAHETQVAWMSDAEARAFAARGGGGSGLLGGGAVPAQRSRSDRPSTRDVPGDASAVGDNGDTETEPVDPLSEPLTLRDAVAHGVLPWSVDAAKKRLQRSPTRPEPVGKRGQAALYRRGDLIAWAEQEMSRRQS